MPNLDKLTSLAKKHASLASVAIALGALAVAVSDDDPERETKLVSLGDALASGSAVERKPQTARNLDTNALHKTIRAIRDADPQLVDLGGGLVKPGATYEAGGNLALGTRLVAWQAGCEDLGGRYSEMACLLVPDAATWTVLSSSCKDRDDATWCEVTVRNDAQVEQRPVVFVRRAP